MIKNVANKYIRLHFLTLEQLTVEQLRKKEHEHVKLYSLKFAVILY